MQNILLYTFRTFPLKEDLKFYFNNFFILHKLKQDLNSLCTQIIKVHPTLILGVALSKGKTSLIEPIAINN